MISGRKEQAKGLKTYDDDDDGDDDIKNLLVRQLAGPRDY